MLRLYSCPRERECPPFRCWASFARSAFINIAPLVILPFDAAIRPAESSLPIDGDVDRDQSLGNCPKGGASCNTIDRALMARYAHQGRLVRHATEISVVQSIRPFLENYFRARFPRRFADDIFLYDMVAAFEVAGASDPKVQFVSDIKVLNEFTREHMHGGSQIPDPTAQRAQAKKVIRIIGHY